jgi:peptidoglycan hydrolase CwlO-like protein
MEPRLLGGHMTEELYGAEWIRENPHATEHTIRMLKDKIQELQSKLSHNQEKRAKLEAQNKEFKLTIKDMDRRIMRGLKD